MTKRLTTEEFIEKSEKIHGCKYDYSKVKYVNSLTKVCIICPKHGEFWQEPCSHVLGHGCPKCRSEKISELRSYNTSTFIEKAKSIHGDRYDYNKVEYVNSKTKVCIICPVHGEFWQLPSDHLRGIGCNACSGRKRLTKEDFIIKALKSHINIYDYSKVNYINNSTKVEIICPIHGSFYQTPASHLLGNCCPMCRESKGESAISMYLDVNNIEYKKQYNIHLDEKLFSRNKLRIDFYLPKFNTFIEFNGQQHYKYMPFFHKTEDDFIKQIERDKRLREYCKKHKINLIEIKYNELDDIKKILDKKLRAEEFTKAKYLNACLEIAKDFIPLGHFESFEKELNLKFNEL